MHTIIPNISNEFHNRFAKHIMYLERILRTFTQSLQVVELTVPTPSTYSEIMPMINFIVCSQSDTGSMQCLCKALTLQI